MGGFGGVPVCGIAVVCGLNIKGHCSYLCIACFGNIILNGKLDEWIEIAAHYSKSADYLCIGILFSYILEKFCICFGIFGSSVLHILGIGIVVCAEIYNDNVRGIACEIPLLCACLLALECNIAAAQLIIVTGHCLICNLLLAVGIA